MAEQQFTDVIGFEVEALDGHAGKVTGIEMPDDRSTCLVVKPGILRKKHMIPAETVRIVDRRHHRVMVRMTRHNILDAPAPYRGPYDTERDAERWDQSRDPWLDGMPRGLGF
jgi:hypothetical protein